MLSRPRPPRLKPHLPEPKHRDHVVALNSQNPSYRTGGRKPNPAKGDCSVAAEDSTAEADNGGVRANARSSPDRPALRRSLVWSYPGSVDT